ncbi:hypothetical protein AMJ49_05300 [Parcubacteria bacterium DG_74_2]|nr:MAG: hypothetical protein AMJ49_05300 [Parcubacteria bacterium DG_74_2]
MFTGIGISQKDNLIEAGKEAAQKAKQELTKELSKENKEYKKPNLLMFFCTFTYPKEQYEPAQKQIIKVFEAQKQGEAKIPLIGGTTMGFFAKDKYYFDPSLMGKYGEIALKALGKVFKPLKFTGSVVLALQSDYINLGVGIGENAFEKPYEAGKISIEMAGKNLMFNPQLAYMSMLKRGVKDISKIRPVNGFLITPGGDKQGLFHDSQILEGVTSISKTALRIQGGGLCMGFSESGATVLPGFIFYQGKVYKEAVISVILGSELEIGYGVGTGFRPLKNIGLITKIKDPWTIEEIDGKPAPQVFMQVYSKYAPPNKREEFIKNFAVSSAHGYMPIIAEPGGNFFWPILPNAEKIGEKEVKFMMPVKQGMSLSLGKVTKEACKEATIDATQLMIEDIDSKNFGFVLFFSCAVRGLYLGKEYIAEIKKIKETLGNKDIPVFGIASSGEQAFYKTGSPVGTGLTITIMGISNESIFISKEAR